MKNRDKKYWIKLQERYFDALTNEEEELQLHEFVAQTNDPDFSELQAVLGYSAATTARIKPKETLRKPKLWLKYAAVATLLCGIALAIKPGERHEDCIAYVNGKALYDEASIMALMQSTASEVINSDEDIALDLLQDMFETINIE